MMPLHIHNGCDGWRKHKENEKKEESLSDYERYPDVNTLSKKDQNGWDRM